MGIVKAPAKGDWRNIRIYQTVDGLKTYTVRVADKDGNPLFCETFDRADEARRWRDEKKAYIKGMSVIGAKAASLTMTTIFDWYAENVLPGRKGEDEDRSTINGILKKSCLADLRIVDVRPLHVRQFIADRLAGNGFKRRVVAETVNRNLNVLSAVFSKAAKRKDVRLPDGNPVHAVERPAVDWTPKNRKRRAPTPDEISMILNSIAEKPYILAGGTEIDAAAMFRIALATGMRLGTLCALTFDQFDEENRCIHTTEEQQKNGEDASIPLMQTAFNEFQRMTASAEDMNARIWPVPSSNSASMYFSRLKRRLKLPGEVVFHSTRHHFTTEIFFLLEDALLARKFTGHKTSRAFEGYESNPALRLAELADRKLAEQEARLKAKMETQNADVA